MIENRQNLIFEEMILPVNFEPSLRPNYLWQITYGLKVLKTNLTLP
jgi:hypothetical protein